MYGIGFSGFSFGKGHGALGGRELWLGSSPVSQAGQEDGLGFPFLSSSFLFGVDWTGMAPVISYGF